MIKQITTDKYEFNKKEIFLSLFTIGMIGLLFRFYFEPQIALTGDATNYFVYAADTSLKGKLSDVYFLANSGWSIFLSMIFSTTKLDDPLLLMQLQRSASIFISVLTIVPIYFLCRKFFNSHYSLIGATLFLFEPHIIINSTLGITEPIFLLLGISSLVFFLSKNKKIEYFSFVLLGLFSIIRVEGLLFFGIISILYFVKYKNKKKNYLKYPVMLGIFTLILLPVAYVNFETHQRDGFLSELSDYSNASYKNFVEGVPDIGDPIYGKNETANIQNFVSNGIKNTTWTFGLFSVPLFIILVPIGIVTVIKNRNNFQIDFQVVAICLVTLITLITSFYMYARGMEDVRFLFMVMPFLVMISLYGISKWKIKDRVFIIFAIIGIIMITAFLYMDFKKIDYDYEDEVFFISRFIAERTDIINSDSADIRYRTAAGIVAEWPDLPSASSDTHVERGLKLISPIEYDSLTKFIQDSKDEGLTHLAVDGKENQPEFLRDVFYHYENYGFLTKIFDSDEYEMDYQVKIFEINYENMVGNK